jgi:hypothetical protein
MGRLNHNRDIDNMFKPVSAHVFNHNPHTAWADMLLVDQTSATPVALPPNFHADPFTLHLLPRC